MGASDGLSLRVNGKPDASTHVDLSTQLLLAHLPMLARPGAKDVFMLGLGSGVSAGALLAYPVEQAVVAENCEPVVRAARLFEPWNRGALDDPRVRIWGEDARTVLKLHPQLYDVIITQPSNPWTAGIGSVFSREYYELAASRLKPGGIVAQWFHVYEMHDGIVSMVLRTFGEAFPFVEVWDTGKGDIVLLGSLQPWPAEPEEFRHGFALEGVRADMASIGIHSPEALVARQLASQRTAFAIPGPGAIQTDQFPVLEYAAPRAFYIGVSSTVLNRFDERTREQLLAPASKRDTLQALTPQDVRSVFAVYKSMNSELLDSMKGNETTDSPTSIFGAGLRQQPGSDLANSSEAAVLPVDEAVEALNAGELRRTREMLMSPPGSREEAQRIGYVSRILQREREFKLARTTRGSGGG